MPGDSGQGKQTGRSGARQGPDRGRGPSADDDDDTMNVLSILNLNRVCITLFMGLLTFGGGAEGFCCLCYNEQGQLDICCPGLGLGAEGGEFTAGVTILDLTFKGLPIVPNADDPDPKDMIVKRFKYPAISPGIEDQGLTRRLVMRAKSDGAQHELSYDRKVQGDFESSIRVAVNHEALEGLVDGVSRATYRFEQVGTPAEGGPVELSMTATWNAQEDGFTISAADQDGPLGEPVVLGGVRDVVLHMRWDEFGRSLQAFPADFFFEAGPFEFFYDDEVVAPDVDLQSWFGAHGLDRKGMIFFTHLMLRSASLAAGNGEVGAALVAAAAVQRLETALILADPNFPFGTSPGAAAQNLAIGAALLEQAETLLAEAGSNVHPTTQRKLAERGMRAGIKRSEKSAKLGNKLEDKGKDTNKSLFNKINRARWKALLVQAQLFGFKSKSIDHYFDTLIVDAPSIFL